MIRLSIIVPVFNTEKYLARCLDSLVEQDIAEDQYEILIINDGSPDNSSFIARDYVSKYSQVRYHEHENIGLFETRNKGIALAEGKFVYFVDSDDFIAKNVLGKIVGYMERAQLDVFGFGIVKTTSSTITSPSLDHSTFEALPVYEGPAYISKFDYPKESVWLVINKAFLEANSITNINGDAFSDGLFTTETLFYAKRIAVIPDPVYAYFQHSGSILHKESPGHYRSLLKRYEATSRVFRLFIKKIEPLQTLSDAGLQRMKNKEISYIFFMLVRAVKSDLSLQEMGQLLDRLRAEGFYPIKGFIGEDYNGPIYNTLVVILNNRYLLYPAVIVYRTMIRLKNAI
jgi:glycosyltransferase involved in cell wall biosynthesis